MQIQFYKPNRSGTGCAFAFKVVPDDRKSGFKKGLLGFMFTAILQAEPLQGRAGEAPVFEGNKDNPDANCVGKLEEHEAADIIRVIDQIRYRPSVDGKAPYPPQYSCSFFHNGAAQSKSIEFYPFNMNRKMGNKSVEDLAFSFTVRVGSDGPVFKTFFTQAEAYRLKIFLQNGFHHIDAQRLLRENKFRQSKQGDPEGSKVSQRPAQGRVSSPALPRPSMSVPHVG